MQQVKWVDGKHLHYGYTTGSCAAAAAKAAVQALFSGGNPKEVVLMTPKGWELCLPVTECQIFQESAVCAVRKQAGDDPDVTDGILIYATVRKTVEGITIEGGDGIGRVTKAGLDQPVGAAAINSVPRKMIEEMVLTTGKEYGYSGGFEIIISAPEGSRIAKETYNEKLGVIGGISILGTSGIVEPMSQQAMIDTMDAEMSVLAEEGHKKLLLVLGNYGERFAREQLGLKLDCYVKCSNYIGKAFELAVQHGFEQVLLVGHIGKLCKLSLGIMNSHSSEADGRIESLIACAMRAGANNDHLRIMDQCVTTDAALEILQAENLLVDTMGVMKNKTVRYLSAKVANQLQIEVVCFTNKETLPLLLYATDNAGVLAKSFAEAGMQPLICLNGEKSENIERVVEQEPLFLFGGTTEGRKLAEYLSALEISTKAFVVSDYGKDLLPAENQFLQISSGRLDEEQMVAEFQRCRPWMIVDATHPYADKVSENIQNACLKTGIEYCRLIRESERINESGASEQIYPVTSLEEMIRFCNQEKETMIFSTLGTKELSSLQGITDYKTRLIVRVLPTLEAIRTCEAAGLKGKQIIAMQGPFSEKMNEDMFRESGAGILLTKESGNVGGYSEKIKAALNCNMKILVLQRPTLENGNTLEEMKLRILKRRK